MATLNGNDQQYTSGDWWARNNVWGRGSLVNGSDFTQSVTLDTSTFPNGTVLQWNWPPGPQGVRSSQKSAMVKLGSCQVQQLVLTIKVV